MLVEFFPVTAQAHVLDGRRTQNTKKRHKLCLWPRLPLADLHTLVFHC